MRTACMLVVVLSVCSCRHVAPRQSPTVLGGGAFSYKAWGRSPPKVEKMLNRLAKRYCGAQNSTYTVDRTEVVTPGESTEMEIVFHCDAGGQVGQAPSEVGEESEDSDS